MALSANEICYTVYIDKCTVHYILSMQSAAVPLVTVGGSAIAAWLLMSFGISQWQR